MPASMSSALPTPSPSANAASLITWQTIRPEHQPGRVADPRDVLAQRGEEALGGASAAERAMSGPRVSSTRLASSSGGSAWKPTALPPGSSAASEPAAQQMACGRRPGAARRAPRRAGQIEDQERRLAVLRPRAGAHLPARLAAAAPQLVRRARLAGDHDSPSPPPARRAARDRAGGAPPAPPGSRSSRARSCARCSPAATVRARDRRRPPARLAEALLVEERETSRPASTPTRSISSNGPMRKPPPSRQMRSISSSGGDPLLQQPQRLEPERAVAAVDEEARPVGGVDHVLAHRLAGRARHARAPRSRGLLAGDDLEQPHHRRRVEEVHPDDALGVLAARGDRGDGQRGGVRREHAVLGRRSPPRGARTARA